MTEKLQFDVQSIGDWVIDFKYRGKLVTEDFVRGLIKKQLLSLNEMGYKLFEEVIKEINQEKAKPRPLSINPWATGGDAA
jgi:hypothetical protein